MYTHMYMYIYIYMFEVLPQGQEPTAMPQKKLTATLEEVEVLRRESAQTILVHILSDNVIYNIVLSITLCYVMLYEL